MPVGRWWRAWCRVNAFFRNILNLFYLTARRSNEARFINHIPAIKYTEDGDRDVGGDPVSIDIFL
jgi:hypothetical protein